MLKMSNTAVFIAMFFVSGIICEEGDNLVNCEGSLNFPPPLNEIKCVRYIFFPNYASTLHITCRKYPKDQATC